MAYGYLKPHLLPWQQHGMDYALSKDILTPELSLCFAQNISQNHKTNQVQNRINPKPSNAVNPQHNTHNRYKAKQQVVSENSSSQSQNAYEQDYEVLAPMHWPTAWQNLLTKTPPAAVVWTYFSLGDDLSGNPKDERRDFMRKLLIDLGHPRGTHSFWPCALPTENTAQSQVNMQVFWSGVEQLKARAIVAMGQPATKAMGLDSSLRPFMHTRHNGCFVVVLRDVDFLISEPHLYGNVREFLRRSLAPFAKR